MPTLRARAGIDSPQLGIALAGLAVGLVVGTRAAGPILRRTGARRAIRGGVPVLASSLGSLPLASGLLALTAAFSVVGLVSGLLDVAMNLETVAVEERHDRRIMSSSHAMWSVSMMAAASIASLAIADHAGIVPSFIAVSAAMAVVSFPLLRWLPAADARRADGLTGPAATGTATLSRVAALCLIGFAMFMTEGIAADWSAVYLRDVDGASGGVAGLGVVAFSAGMTTSRFVGDVLGRRFAPRMILRIATLLAASTLVVASVAGAAPVTVAALALVGLCLGPAVPYTFGAAGRASTGPRRTALPPVVTASYRGSIVGPLAVGATASIAGLELAFAVPVAMCVATAAVAPALAVGPGAR
jgi:predicted MFS family arabinose efflux permease